MPITVVHDAPQTIWAPIEYGNTIYTGSVVAMDYSGVADYSGLEMLPLASGQWNGANTDIPIGCVIGNNLRRTTYDATALADKIVSATPLASTTEFVSTGGPYPGGAREPMMKLAVIDPSTVCRANLVVDTPGTAITVATVSTGDANGVSCTTSAADVATVEGWATIYFRTGANKGTYRVLDSSASTQTHTWNIPTYAAVSTAAPWDTCVIVNILPCWLSRVQLAATYLNCFDIDAAVTDDWFAIDTLRLDLAADHEFVEFRWNAVNFIHEAARTTT